MSEHGDTITGQDELKPNVRWCYFVDETMMTPRGIIPAVVYENESGYYPLAGRDGGEPWYWGDTIEKAQEVCDHANSEIGLTPAQARDIVQNSMRVQAREEAQREENDERLARLKKGRD